MSGKSAPMVESLFVRSWEGVDGPGVRFGIDHDGDMWVTDNETNCSAIVSSHSIEIIHGWLGRILEDRKHG